MKYTSQDIAGMEYSMSQVIAGMDHKIQDIAGMEYTSQDIAGMDCYKTPGHSWHEL